MHSTSVGSGPLTLNPGLLVDMLTNGCYSLCLVHCRSPTLRSGSTLIMLQHGVHSIPKSYSQRGTYNVFSSSCH